MVLEELRRQISQSRRSIKEDSSSIGQNFEVTIEKLRDAAFGVVWDFEEQEINLGRP